MNLAISMINQFCKLALICVSSLLFAANATAAALPNGAVLTVESGSSFDMGCGGAIITPLLSEKGLVVSQGFGDTGTGSHAGPPVPTDIGAVTKPWSFFNATGYDYLATSTSLGPGSFSGDETTGADMTAWTVTWNGILAIPMGGCSLGDPANNGGFSGCDASPPDGVDDYFDTGIGSLTCTAGPDGVDDCSDGDSYSIDYTAHVPVGDPSGFGGVEYCLILTGTIIEVTTPNTAPVAVDDTFALGLDPQNAPLRVADNDFDPDINDAVDKRTVTIVTQPTQGTVTVDPVTGVVSYTANSPTYAGPDSFTYTVNDFRGPVTSNIATATLAIGVNAKPVAVDDSGSVDLATTVTVIIDVTANDFDVDGTIDPATVEIVTDAGNGTTSINPVTGEVAYTSNGTIGTDTFTYRVMDDEPEFSNVATVVISVFNSSITGLPSPAFFIMETGNVTDTLIEPPLGNGSWFSMEVQPGQPLHTPIAGFNHLELDTVQPASSVPLVPDIDQGWVFFGNIGVHQTTSTVAKLTDDGAGNVTLDFVGWDVSWNAIASIPLGSGQDNGIATLTCYTDLALLAAGTCAYGDEFVIEYRAIVPPGDPSGFGGVNYRLHMEGVISEIGSTIGGICIDDPNNALCAYDVDVASAIDANGAALSITPGNKAESVGNTTGFGLTSSDIGVSDPLMNPTDGVQCVGGCADFIVANLTTDYMDIVYNLNVPVPSDSTQLRKLQNGIWQDFNSSGGDLIGSATADANGNCQGPQGVFSVGLRAGNACVYLRIFDGGPNDADGLKDGKVTDPSGVLLAGSPNVPPGSTSGCSISSNNTTLKDRADWLILAAFISLLFAFRLRQTKV